MVIGVAKDVVQVLTAIAVYGDAFGVENGMGMALVLGGIVAYGGLLKKAMGSLKPAPKEGAAKKSA